MSKGNEQDQKLEAKKSQKLEAIEKRDQRYQERKAASDHLWDLLRAWASETTCSERAFKRVTKEVARLSKSIDNGNIKNIDERFTKTVERAVASTIRKKQVTYHMMSKALEQLVTMNTRWATTTSHSQEENRQMLHRLRLLLLEIEAGQTENIVERFQQAAAAIALTPPQEG